MSDSDSKRFSSLACVHIVEPSQDRPVREAEFHARARDSVAEMERTGISYSIEEVSALLTARIEAKRADLLKGTSFGD